MGYRDIVYYKRKKKKIDTKIIFLYLKYPTKHSQASTNGHNGPRIKSVSLDTLGVGEEILPQQTCVSSAQGAVLPQASQPRVISPREGRMWSVLGVPTVLCGTGGNCCCAPGGKNAGVKTGEQRRRRGKTKRKKLFSHFL